MCGGGGGEVEGGHGRITVRDGGVEDLLWGTECMNLSLNEGAGAGG